MGSPTRSQRREYENGFRPSKTFADAASRPAAKWKVAILRSGLLGFGCPSVRIESRRLWKESRIPLSNKRAEKNDGIGGNHVASNLLFHQRAPADGPCGRIEADRFGDDHFCVTQVGDIFHRWQTSLQ